MNKFEQLLDLIVNEENEKAEELFHAIVVEKSRDIYETLIAEETAEEEEDDEQQDESADEADEAVEEAYGMEDEGEQSGFPGGDATDDEVADVTDADAEDGEEHEEGDVDGDGVPATKSDVQDLEDALEELKAEFEALMAGEKHEEEENPDVHGGALDQFGDDSEEDSEEDSDEEEEEDEGRNPFESRQMTREYRETVGKPYGSGNGISNKTEGGDGRQGPVSSGKGKPTSGATAKNIAQGDNGTEGIKGGEGLVGGVKGEFTKGVEKNIASSSKAGMKSGSTLDGKGKAYGAGGASTSETGAGNTKSVVDKKQS